MKFIRIASVALARFFLSAIFLAGAVNQVMHWGDSERLLANTLSDWQTYVGFSQAAQEFFIFITPWTPLMLIIATLLQIVGGLLLLLGVQEKWGASLLILFLIPATVLFHAFWLFDDVEAPVQSIMFLKNLGLMGGLMMVLLYGAQPVQR
ncbi:MAG: hypothetical protein RL235_1022 [Chlamydiota bacterium]|jgi:uncharacterized membrane protein YphA (DoxX/SURF4 family)